MPVTIAMPALSPTMTEGKLAKWLVKEGDTVDAGTALAEIETDKATMEFEAVDQGVLGKILIPAGTEGVKVNTPIAILLLEGEDKSALAAAQAKMPAPAPPAFTPSAPAPPAPAKLAVVPPAVGETSAGESGRIRASPLAKRLAKVASIDLGQIAGSGPRGRIVQRDVEAIMGSAVKPPAPAPTAAAAVATEMPLDNIRRTIARRMLEAKQTIPHFYLSVDCLLDELLALRAKINAISQRPKISLNDFVIRAAGLALEKVPDANAAWGGDKIVKFPRADISVAVATARGLMTPIVRDAANKSVLQISAEMRDLAARAKTGKLKLEEFQGGTFTVSNLGMYGIAEFAAIINPPQAAILAIGASERRAVVKEDAIVAATLMTCTLSCDHRVIDGVLGANFLAEFRKLIEQPLRLLV
jgi:pyruvate dehydrogenase E2 component (dihydrolipoamide acetyltransferase)